MRPPNDVLYKRYGASSQQLRLFYGKLLTPATKATVVIKRYLHRGQVARIKTNEHTRFYAIQCNSHQRNLLSELFDMQIKSNNVGALSREKNCRIMPIVNWLFARVILCVCVPIKVKNANINFSSLPDLLVRKCRTAHASRTVFKKFTGA